MDVDGVSAVVTGAAGGIGAAIAARLLEAGARVTLVDIEGARLERTARDLEARHPDRVAWHAGDIATDSGIADLLAVAAPRFGAVRLYVANAGIFRGFGLDADDFAWESSWQVNVMAHVRAARALVPGWLGGDGGCFAVTASAAGLLTQLGSPTYATTKHAAVGFAEWLAATYGDRGVQVACLAPMGVRTAMVEAGETSDDPDARLGMRSVASAGEVVAPEEAADALLAAIADGQFFALPHPHVGEMYAQKAADTDRWIAVMQRFRGQLDG